MSTVVDTTLSSGAYFAAVLFTATIVFLWFISTVVFAFWTTTIGEMTVQLFCLWLSSL